MMYIISTSIMPRNILDKNKICVYRISDRLQLADAHYEFIVLQKAFKV